MQVGVVERVRAGMPELRRAPARPRQAVIVAADFRRVLGRAQRYQIELRLVAHMRLQSLRRLATIAGRPSAAVDLTQDIFRKRLVVLDLDVLEHAVSEAELLGEEIQDRKSTRLNSSHMSISYAVFCLKKKRPMALFAPR